jgi:hypothetical protein
VPTDHNPHARWNDLERIRILRTALAARNRDIARLHELLEQEYARGAASTMPMFAPDRPEDGA